MKQPMIPPEPSSIPSSIQSKLVSVCACVCLSTQIPKKIIAQSVQVLNETQIRAGGASKGGAPVGGTRGGLAGDGGGVRPMGRVGFRNKGSMGRGEGGKLSV